MDVVLAVGRNKALLAEKGRKVRNVKFRIKIHDRELEAEGDDEFVTKQFDDFVNGLKAEYKAASNRSRQLRIQALLSEEVFLSNKLKTVRKQLLSI